MALKFNLALKSTLEKGKTIDLGKCVRACLCIYLENLGKYKFLYVDLYRCIEYLLIN